MRVPVNTAELLGASNTLSEAFDVVKYLETIYVNITQYFKLVSCLNLRRGVQNRTRLDIPKLR